MLNKSLPVLLVFSFLYVGAAAQQTGINNDGLQGQIAAAGNIKRSLSSADISAVPNLPPIQQNIHYRLDSLIRAVDKIEHGFKRFLEERKYRVDHWDRNITEFLLGVSKNLEEQNSENEKLKRLLDKQEDLIKRQESQLKEMERKIDNLERKIK